MELGTKLRMLRKRCGYTLLEVSGRTELSVSFLSDMERGRTKPSLETLEKLATLYGQSGSDLLSDVDFGPTSSQSAHPPGFDEFVRQDAVDEDMQELLLQVEHRAKQKPRNPQEWREYYYSLKRIMGR